MLNTIGDRITYCRNLLGLARNEMSEKIGESISLPTLARWELNTVSPSQKKIKMLVSFFLNHGINVNLDWISKGVGYPPLSDELKEFNPADFDELAYTTLIEVREKVKDFYFFQVNSNFFRPIISFGDYVGGIIEKNQRLLDKKICFLLTTDFSLSGIYHHETKSINNLSGDFQNISDTSETLGEIQWIIRRP